MGGSGGGVLGGGGGGGWSGTKMLECMLLSTLVHGSKII